MEANPVQGLTLFYDAEEGEAAELIGEACAQTVQLLKEYWGLEIPEDLRVYVMTSWFHFLFHSPPWPWRILVALALPFLYLRIRRMWPYVGGWEQRFGRRRAVGVKPPWLLAEADRSIGARIFVPEENIEEKVALTTCHELSHAFVAHLQLPNWLKEGQAMVTVDQFAGKLTVRAETLEALERYSARARAASDRRISVQDPDAAVYLYTRGYWITRFLDEAQPELLRDLLEQRMPHQVLENRIADTLGMSREEFWKSIDQTLVAHFKQAAVAS
ncbi:MAG: hypothetical protein PVI80_04285 [Anaerolineae bacterium]|jgi:hypothetical protein